jgi:hypothetical protein
MKKLALLLMFVCQVARGQGNPRNLTVTEALRLPSIPSLTLQTQADGRVVGVSQSGFLDQIGNAQGSIIYRSATGWVSLSPGTNGQYLKTQGASANPVWATVSGGSGSGDLLSTNNLSDLTNFTTARSNLGLAIGTNVQAHDNDLDTWATLTPSSFFQTLVDDANAAAARTTLGLVIGTDVLAPNGSGSSLTALNASNLSSGSVPNARLDSDLQIYAGITPSANVQSLLGAADYSAMRTLLSLVAGTDVQGYDPDLQSWKDVTRATGFDTFTAAPSSANAASMLTDEIGSGGSAKLLFGDQAVSVASNVTHGNITASGKVVLSPATSDADKTLLSFTPEAATASQFGMRTWKAHFDDGQPDDNIVIMGWNRGPGGGDQRIKTDRGAIWMQFEDFASLTDPDTLITSHVNEWHVDWMAIDGSERRPYFATGNEDTGALTVVSQSSEYQFLNFTGLSDTPTLICKVEAGGFKVYGSATATLTCAGTQNQNLITSLNTTDGSNLYLSNADARAAVYNSGNKPLWLSCNDGSGATFQLSSGTNKDVEIASTGGYCIGGTSTDGTWRPLRSSNDLVFQRRESGSYVTKATITSSGNVTVADQAYGSGWNGDPSVPTKNAVYDKIESLSIGGFDSTAVVGSKTWGDGSTDTIVWTFNRATGTDPTITFNSGSVGFQAITLSSALAVSSGGTGITSFGTGVAGALGQAVTGSNSIVLSTSPTITTPRTLGQVTLTASGGGSSEGMTIQHSLNEVALAGYQGTEVLSISGFDGVSFGGMNLSDANDLSLAGGLTAASVGSDDITSIDIEATGQLKGGDGVYLLDAATANYLLLKSSESLGAARTLDFKVNGANRTINLSGNLIVTGSGTLNITSGKTLNVSNTLTFTGTDSSSVAFGAGGTVAYTNVASLSSLTTVGTLAAGNATAIVDAASTSAAGKAEIATSAETTTGSDTGRVISPDSLRGSDYGKRVAAAYISGILTTGDGKLYLRIPSSMNGWNLVSVAADVVTKSTSGTPTFMISRGRESNATTAHSFVDMLTTALTIDANEFDSQNATTAAVIDTSNDDVNTGDLIRIDIDTAGTGTADATFSLQFQKP